MPIEQAERIAQSQVAWAILFIILFGFDIRYLIKTSDKLESKLMEFHEQTQLNNSLGSERRLCMQKF